MNRFLAAGVSNTGRYRTLRKPRRFATLQLKDTNVDGREKSEIKSWLNSEFKDMLPQDLKSVIVSVDKLTNNVGESTDASSVTELFSEQDKVASIRQKNAMLQKGGFCLHRVGNNPVCCATINVNSEQK